MRRPRHYGLMSSHSLTVRPIPCDIINYGDSQVSLYSRCCSRLLQLNRKLRLGVSQAFDGPPALGSLFPQSPNLAPESRGFWLFAL